MGPIGLGLSAKWYAPHFFVPIPLHYRWLYWNSNRGIEKMSMDGKNRTIIINLERRQYYVDTILSLTLDYQAQMLYWIFYHRNNDSLVIESSNVNGTNQQTILPLINNTVNYRHSLRFPPRLTIYNDIFFLFSPWSDEIYKLRTSGDNFMTFANSLAFCRDNYHLKVTEQPPGELHALCICQPTII